MKSKSKRKSVQRVNVKTDKGKFELSQQYNLIFLIATLVLPLVTSYFYYSFGYESNGFLSFPLDDPWIHLTFAKNITKYFSFSYFKDEIVTAGSTSPLYTFILAAGFLFYKNEILLSFIFGVLFFSVSSFIMFKLLITTFPRQTILAFFVTCVFIMDQWINFISLSEMETTLFILILISCSYFYKIRNAVPFAITLGLIIWCRPDGIVFILAVLLTYIIEKYYYKKTSDSKSFDSSELKSIIYISSGLILLYCFMNLYLSGSILPNTYSAKVFGDINAEKRINFVTEEVWKYFTSGHYSLLMVGFFVSLVKFSYTVHNRSYNQITLYVFFILIFIVTYSIELPSLNRFGRYGIPLIPFFIIISMNGFNDLFGMLNKYLQKSFVSKIAFLIFFPVIFYFSGKDYENAKKEFARECKHIYERQVVTAMWIRENTEESDIIATHDIGAIGFYSDRKIADVAGLVNPELNKHLNDKNYTKIITDYCIQNKVSYLAFLHEWYGVLNQNPVFSAPEFTTRENMYVYRFYPGKTRLVSRDAHSLLWKAFMEFETKNFGKIVSITNKVLEIEPDHAYALLLRANAYLQLKDFMGYENDVKKSIALFPDFTYSILSYANFLFSNKRFEESKVYFEKLVSMEPGNTEYNAYLKSVNDSLKTQPLEGR